MADHVMPVCHSVYYKLQLIRPILRPFSEDAARILVETFISSRLDYCSAMLYSITDNLYQ